MQLHTIRNDFAAHRLIRFANKLQPATRSGSNFHRNRYVGDPLEETRSNPSARTRFVSANLVYKGKRIWNATRFDSKTYGHLRRIDLISQFYVIDTLGRASRTDLRAGAAKKIRTCRFQSSFSFSRVSRLKNFQHKWQQLGPRDDGNKPFETHTRPEKTKNKQHNALSLEKQLGIVLLKNSPVLVSVMCARLKREKRAHGKIPLNARKHFCLQNIQAIIYDALYIHNAFADNKLHYCLA